MYGFAMRAIAFVAPILLTGLMSGCGGGDGDSPASPPASIPPPSPQVSFSPGSVSATADVAAAPPASAIVEIKVTTAPSTNFVYKLTWTGSAVASATFAWESSALGQLNISFPTPASLGPGSFTGSVQLTVCSDTACTKMVSGSPVTVPVAFTVTRSSAGAATFTTQTSTATFVAHTADAGPPAALFNIFLQNVPPAGLYIQPSQPTSGFVVAIANTQSVDTSGQITVALTMTLVKPATLGSGFFSSSITFKVCYDQACTQQLPGSPATEEIYYRVYLTEGVEYSVKSVTVDGASDLAYDKVGGKLYASGLSGYSSSSSGAVTQIDPATGTIGTQTGLSDSLIHIATSDDGSLVYVGSVTNPVVHRLSLPALVPDIDIALGSTGDPNLDGGPNIVSELAVAPGAAHTLAVSLAHAQGNKTGGTVVYDDAVARPQILAALGDNAQPDAIAWGTDAATLYAYRFSYELPLEQDIATVAVSASGLAVTHTVAVDPSIYAFGRTFYAAGRVYDVFGHVLDATSGALLGQFTFPVTDPIAALLPDPSHDRVFVLQTDGQALRVYLLVYDATTFALESVIDMGAEVAALTGIHPILWGSEGVAVVLENVQILSGSFYAAPSASSSAIKSAKASQQQILQPGIHVNAAPKART